MKIKRVDSAVSEVVGTILLLMIAVSLFSIMYIVVFSIPPPAPSPSVNIVGTIEGNNIILEHRGGEALSLDTKVLLTIGTDEYNITVRGYLDEESKADGVWNIGERLVPAINIAGLRVRVTVVDVESDSVVMTGVLQE